MGALAAKNTTELLVSNILFLMYNFSNASLLWYFCRVTLISSEAKLA